MDELWDDYLQYLIWRCGLQKKTRYVKLFDILHHIDFRYIIDRDDNREEDGIDLREDYDISYDYDENIKEDFYNSNCSVMEMLVGLAIRVDDEFIGDPAEEHPEDFFMEMIENLGLDEFKGKHFYESGVIKIIDRWLDREFERNGRGSPFPITYDYRDQRKLEIWDQMNSYINENYN